MLIDTHCHIHDVETYKFALTRQQAGKKLRRVLEEDPDYGHYPLEISDFTGEKIISRAEKAGIQKMITVGTSDTDSRLACEFAERHDNVFWSYGIHPDEATSVAESGWNCPSLESFAYLVAIGEVGLDYHGKTSAEDGDFQGKQMKLFEQMLQLARDNNLPLIFHVREAFDDFFAILANFPEVRGVVHSFSDTKENMMRALERGFYIGVNGMATFADDFPLPPLERMLLETDAPFLTPVPFRGTINEPAHIRDICAYISKIKGESEREIAKITTQNAEQLFRI